MGKKRTIASAAAPLTTDAVKHMMGAAESVTMARVERTGSCAVGNSCVCSRCMACIMTTAIRNGMKRRS